MTSCKSGWNTPRDATDPEPLAVYVMSALPRRVIVGYGLPGLIAALPVIPVAVLLPSWYATDLGLGLIVTGAVLGAARIVDFASDLVVGMLADRLNWRGLRYKPLVLIGALIAGAGLFALASPPTPATAWWLAFGSIVLFTGWTLLMVPYTAWGAELSQDFHERSRLTASREVAGLCGIVLALALPLIAANFPGTADIEPLIALCIAAFGLGLPAMIGFALLVPEPAVRANQNAVSLTDVVSLWRVIVFRRTLMCWFVNGIANGLPAVLFPIMVKDHFALQDHDLYRMLMFYFGAAVVGMPLWLMLARRYGKARAWMTAIAVTVLVFPQVLWLDQNTATWFLLICIASGATLGADLALPPSLQADILARDREDSGRRRTATAFALWSMATKIALAVAVVVAFVGLGLTDGAPNESTVSDPTVLLGLYVVVPVALKCVVMILLRGIDARTSTSGNAPTQKREHSAKQRKPLV
ncbi:MAG: GPH family glycoside/pentoside/hexuronide:cation symporter [Gammaproteobacteria bacterium]